MHIDSERVASLSRQHECVPADRGPRESQALCFKVVRKRGFETPRSCEGQPLKLARLKDEVVQKQILRSSVRFRSLSSTALSSFRFLRVALGESHHCSQQAWRSPGAAATGTATVKRRETLAGRRPMRGHSLASGEWGQGQGKPHAAPPVGAHNTFEVSALKMVSTSCP